MHSYDILSVSKLCSYEEYELSMGPYFPGKARQVYPKDIHSKNACRLTCL